MLPQSLLTQLSPAAAKLYLALLTLQPPNSPLIHAPLKTLCPLTNLSDKSCRRAPPPASHLKPPHRPPRASTTAPALTS